MIRFKNSVKKLFSNKPVVYKILSFLINFNKNHYLPPKINNIQDILSHFAFLNSNIYFIQVGSNDGVSNDPLFNLINKNNWSGILIEPVSHLFDKLKNNYRDNDKVKILNVAIANTENETLFMYTIDEKHVGVLPDWYFQLNSFNLDVLLSHGIKNIERYIKKTPIKVRTLNSVIKEFQIPHLSLLHIDAEGYDFEILKSLDLVEYKPDIILIEYIHHNIASRKVMFAYLRSCNYCLFRCDNDIIAIGNLCYPNYKKSIKLMPTWHGN